MRVDVLAAVLVVAAVAAPSVAAGGDCCGFDWGANVRSAFFATFLVALLIGGAIVLLVNMSKPPPQKPAEAWKDVTEQAPKKSGKSGRKRR